MKISWFKQNITPEIGTKVSGYAMEDVSFSKLNDLFMTGLLADDGMSRVLLVSFDLQCLDVEYIHKFRRLCAGILGIAPETVMLTFTHTHGGPQTNGEANYEDRLNIPYLEELEKLLAENCRKLSAQAIDCDVYYYSTQIDENLNRRLVLPDNYDVFLPHHNELRPLANGFKDQELGCLFFYSKESDFPVYVIGNYAAHPLASHGPGTGGRQIAADYPGVFRDHVTQETGAETMFISGACGDMIPLCDELGSDGMRRMGIHLAEGAFRGLIDVQRNRERYRMKAPKVGALCRSIQAPLRPAYLNNPKRLCARDKGKTHTELEIQCLAIGEVCFVGVPGEWCAELGAEVKWHSAFRKAYIAFSATAYQDYMCPANFMLQGGYEAFAQHFQSQYSIAMVKTAVDAMFELREKLYPLPEDPLDVPQYKVNQFVITPTELPLNNNL